MRIFSFFLVLCLSFLIFATTTTTTFVSAENWYNTTTTPIFQATDTNTYYFHLITTINTTALYELHGNEYLLDKIASISYVTQQSFNNYYLHTATMQLQYGLNSQGHLYNQDILSTISGGGKKHLFDATPLNQLILKNINVPIQHDDEYTSSSLLTFQMTILFSAQPRSSITYSTSQYQLDLILIKKNKTDGEGDETNINTQVTSNITYSIPDRSAPTQSKMIEHPVLPDIYQMYLDPYTTTNRELTLVTNNLTQLSQPYYQNKSISNQLNTPLTTKTITLSILGTNNYRFYQDKTRLHLYYPQTHQRANCLFNNYPINVTISPNSPQTLLFDTTLNDIYSALIKENDRPIIQCYDIFLKHSNYMGDHSNIERFIYNTLLYTIETTTTTILTQIDPITHQIVYQIHHENTKKEYYLPITFFSGILPSLVLGTQLYKSLPAYLPPEVHATSASPIMKLDYYIWDFIWPFDEDDIENDEMYKIVQQNVISPTFVNFHDIKQTKDPKTGKVLTGLVKTTNNIIKLNTPYDEFNEKSIIVNITQSQNDNNNQPILNIGQHFYNYQHDIKENDLNTEDYSSHLRLSFTNYTVYDNKYTNLNQNNDHLVLGIILQVNLTSLYNPTTIPVVHNFTFKSFPILYTTPIIPYDYKPQFLVDLNAQYNIINNNDEQSLSNYHALKQPISTAIAPSSSSQTGGLKFDILTNLYNTITSTTNTAYTDIKVTSWDKTKGHFSGNCNTCYISNTDKTIYITKNDGLTCWVPYQTPTDGLNNNIIDNTNIQSTSTVYFKSTKRSILDNVTLYCPDLLYHKTTNNIIIESNTNTDANGNNNLKNNNNNDNDGTASIQQQSSSLSGMLNEVSDIDYTTLQQTKDYYYYSKNKNENKNHKVTIQDDTNNNNYQHNTILQHDPYDFNIITIGTNHFGAIQDTIGFIVDGPGLNLTHGMWTYGGGNDGTTPVPPTPVPPTPDDKDKDTSTNGKRKLTGLEITLIVIGSIIAEVLLAIGCFFGGKWGWAKYKEWNKEEVKYQEQRDAIDKMPKPDIMAIGRASAPKNGKKKNTKRFAP